MFYLSDCGQKRPVQYLFEGQTRKDCEIAPRFEYKKGLMVWAAFCSRGTIGPYFVEPGAKINRTYYIQNILKPCLKEIKQLYPDGDAVFQQDSAPSHQARETIEYLRSQNIQFIPPSEWLPRSPDAAPCDFFLWGYLKNKVYKKKIKTVIGLKRAITTELRNIPQDMLDRVLESWPKRLKMIHDVGGHNIEHLL